MMNALANLAEVGVAPAEGQPQLRHNVTKVGVVGTGTMATGIVEVFAKAGFPVTYVGRSDDKVAAVRATIEKSLDQVKELKQLYDSDPSISRLLDRAQQLVARLVHILAGRELRAEAPEKLATEEPADDRRQPGQVVLPRVRDHHLVSERRQPPRLLHGSSIGTRCWYCR